MSKTSNPACLNCRTELDDMISYNRGHKTSAGYICPSCGANWLFSEWEEAKKQIDGRKTLVSKKPSTPKEVKIARQVYSDKHYWDKDLERSCGIIADTYNKKPKEVWELYRGYRDWVQSYE